MRGGIIQDYLIECNKWGYYELTLFTNTLIFHSNDLIDVVYERAKKYLIEYDGIIRYRNELTMLLFNILEKKIKSKQYHALTFYLKDLENINEPHKDHMYVSSMKLYFTKLISYIKTKDQGIICEIEYIISIFKFLNLPFKAEQCLDLLDFVIGSRTNEELK